MMKARGKDLEFIEQHRDNLFTDKNHMIRILRGNLPVPKFPSNNEPLNDFDLRGLTFGQYISWIAQEKKFTLQLLAKELCISRSLLEQIYDDSVPPWDLEKTLIIRLGKILEISNKRLHQIIKDHRISTWLLKQRLPGGASAARTHHTLERKTRQEELLQTELVIQQSREKDKKAIFLSQLFS
jgi:hypothetical protein